MECTPGQQQITDKLHQDGDIVRCAVGQQARAIILTDVDPDPGPPDRAILVQLARLHRRFPSRART